MAKPHKDMLGMNLEGSLELELGTHKGCRFCRKFSESGVIPSRTHMPHQQAQIEQYSTVMRLWVLTPGYCPIVHPK